MTGGGIRDASCALAGRAPCPEECPGRSGCAVIRIRDRGGTERWGVPVAVIGETLRFHQALPGPGILLLPLEALDPESARAALQRTAGAGRRVSRSLLLASHRRPAGEGRRRTVDVPPD